MQVRIEGAVGSEKHAMLALGWVIEGEFFVLPPGVEISRLMQVCRNLYLHIYVSVFVKMCLYIESAPNSTHERGREADMQRERVCERETRLSLAERK